MVMQIYGSGYGHSIRLRFRFCFAVTAISYGSRFDTNLRFRITALSYGSGMLFYLPVQEQDDFVPDDVIAHQTFQPTPGTHAVTYKVSGKVR